MLKKYDDIIPHGCNVNYEGSSGEMESRLAVNLIIESWRWSRCKVSIGTIVADDDLTLKANTENKKDGGLVDYQILRPTFLADPSHRIKCLIRPVFKMV